MATEYVTDVVDPVELTGYVREAVDGELPLGSLLPSVQVDDIEYALTQVEQFVGEVARYRSWDTAPPIGKRPGVATITGEIPPLGWSYRLNELDIIKFNKVRAEVASQFSSEIENRIFNDAVNAAKAVQNRVTLAQAELLTTGQVSLTELGDVVTGNELVADFSVPSTHLGVTPTVTWDTAATATPITDLMDWETVFRADNSGLSPEAWLISPEVEAHLAASNQVRDQLLLSQAGLIITPETMRRVLTASGVRAPLVVIDVERPALDGSGLARLFDAGTVIGLRPSSLGSTLYGISANAATLAGNGTIQFSDAPGIIAFQTQEVRPPQVLTTAEGIVLPVIKDPNALFVAEVLS